MAHTNEESKQVGTPEGVPGSPVTPKTKEQVRAEFDASFKEFAEKQVKKDIEAMEFMIGGVEKEGAVLAYKTLKPLVKGLGLEVHHLFEKRFAGKLGQKAGEMLSIAITKEEHQVFTNAWRKLIPYGTGTKEATEKFVKETAKKVYAGRDEILKALGL